MLPETAHRSPQTRWKLDRDSARLSSDWISASVDLRQLSGGLTLHAGSPPHLLADQLLGMRIDRCGTGEPSESTSGVLLDAYERYVPESRRAILSASYQAGPDRLHVDWNVTLSHAKQEAQFDLLVAVQTELLESYPKVTIRSSQACSRQWGVEASSSAGEPVRVSLLGASDLGATEPPVTTPPAARPLAGGRWDATVWVPAEAPQWTCAEIPFGGDFVSIGAEGPGSRQPTGWIFEGNFFEKGVIRCLRLRAIVRHGSFRPDDPTDLAWLQERRADLLHQPLPLTT